VVAPADIKAEEKSLRAMTRKELEARVRQSYRVVSLTGLAKIDLVFMILRARYSDRDMTNAYNL
jgi:hypothetical protein